MTTLYALDQVEKLIRNYQKKDPNMEMVELEEGCLGYGITMISGENLKTAIITEKYLNEWSSGHTIRLYNKTPKKYEKMLEEYYARPDEEKEENN